MLGSAGGFRTLLAGAELDAAGIRDPMLRGAYEHCRALIAGHGRTGHLATSLLSQARRPAVHALYGLGCWAGDIVSAAPPGTDPALIASRLEWLASDLQSGLRAGASNHLILAAVVDAAVRYRIDGALFRGFFASMRMDLTVTGYRDRAALDAYLYGSAEVIGLQVLPVLGTVTAAAEAVPYAAALGKALALTRFLRDLGEDLDRGRVYLPADELAAFGVDRELLRWCRQRGTTEPRVRKALAAQHDITRAVYAYAKTGIPMLHPASRPCVTTAFTLYGQILNRIEDSGFAVFSRRARVGELGRLRVAGPALARARWTRRSLT